MLILWAGLMLGVSFIATPVKFMAPHLTLPVALEIGKVTFQVFNKVEWSIFTLTLLSLIPSGGNSIKWFSIGGLFILLFLQTFWLLPYLNIRADQIIAGEPANPGVHHWLYISFESLKIIIALGSVWCLKNWE